MQIIGLRIEKYIDNSVSGFNCNFTYTPAEFEKHIICGVLSDGRKVEIELSRSEGECGSGYTTGTFGNATITEVPKFNGYTHVPYSVLVVEDILPSKYVEEISNDVFSMSADGNDPYYPSGWYEVKMSLFRETVRHKQHRPVWIFKGKSNAGKSFIASQLKELKVYETDCCNTLPETIVESVVVLGNKYKFTLDEIKSKLFGKVEIHIVDFD